MGSDELYVSVDIEANGPAPGLFSMLSFGAAAYRADKTLLGTFEANLLPLPEADEHPVVMAWWKTQPHAWHACQQNQQPAETVMPRFRDWLRALPGKPVFVGYPVVFDYMFIHWYLVRFAGEDPFGFAALDIKSFAMARLGGNFRQSVKEQYPSHWFDDLPHTHVALDDALEQGALFCNMLADDLSAAI